MGVPILRLFKLAENLRSAAQEIANLRKEAQAFRAVRKALRLEQSNGGAVNGVNENKPNGVDPARLCFEKVGLL